MSHQLPVNVALLHICSDHDSKFPATHRRARCICDNCTCAIVQGRGVCVHVRVPFGAVLQFWLRFVGVMSRSKLSTRTTAFRGIKDGRGGFSAFFVDALTRTGAVKDGAVHLRGVTLARWHLTAALPVSSPPGTGRAANRPRRGDGFRPTLRGIKVAACSTRLIPTVNSRLERRQDLLRIARAS